MRDVLSFLDPAWVDCCETMAMPPEVTLHSVRIQEYRIVLVLLSI
jgi:hypothetical protein